MIFHRWLFSAALILTPILCTPAFADDLLVTNKSDKTIYSIYAWPSDFPPRTANLIITPLHSQDVRSINIINSYDDCKFTFMIDLNVPVIVKGLKPPKKPMTFDYHNICTEKKPIALLELQDRNIN